jgi:hypothetical protein
MNVATSKSLRLYETALTARAQLADAPALQAELSFTSYVLQRQRATAGTSMEQANRARSLMFTSRMPHDSFLQLIVDSAVPMDTATTDDDDDANGSEPRELRGRIDTSSGRLLTTDLCEQVWEAQLAREEAARLSQERRRAAAEAERPIATALYEFGFTPAVVVAPTKPVLLAFAREQGVTGYSAWKRAKFIEEALKLVQQPPPGGLRRAPVAGTQLDAPPMLTEPLAGPGPALPPEQPAVAALAPPPTSTPSFDRHLPPAAPPLASEPPSLVQSLPESLQVQSPIGAGARTVRRAAAAGSSRSSQLQRLVADAEREAAAAPAPMTVRRSSRHRNADNS